MWVGRGQLFVLAGTIHSKSWFRWFPETTENFEFSAERLSENAKTVSSSMCVRNKTNIIANINTNHCQFSSIITIITKIIDLRSFVAQFYCRDLRTFCAFRMYGWYSFFQIVEAEYSSWLLHDFSFLSNTN